MDQEYDKKFEEMKKYIPFLENMIRRLETSGTGSGNPRQSQLSKIKALRDLLMDKSKRMKLENLLKCEQVLVNLYAKVEQRDTLPGIKSASEVSPPLAVSSSEFESARQKLKIIKTDIECNDTLPDIERAYHRDTLPDIARASQTEAVCSPGSKEPALFQRRQNQASPSIKPSEQLLPTNSNRNYTRVFSSPQQECARSSLTENNSGEQPMFQRRDPNKPKPHYFVRRSPKKSPASVLQNSSHLKDTKESQVSSSPSHYREKRDKKKSTKSDKNRRKSRTEKLNITLKVPEESLSSLNTENIFDRIIDCDDNDVDIGMLRELRSQIIEELKDTGTNEDFSDMILKSCRQNKKVRDKTKKEIEEGELTDSESEVIDNVYGSFVIVENDKKSAIETTSKDKLETNDKSESRKIQICLVFAEKTQSAAQVESATCVSSENEKLNLEEITDKLKDVDQSTPKKKSAFKKALPTDDELNRSLEDTLLISLDDSERFDFDGKDDSSKTLTLDSPKKNLEKSDSPKVSENPEPKENRANFYKSIHDSETATPHEIINENNENNTVTKSDNAHITQKPEPALIMSPMKEKPKESDSKTDRPKIPFLSEPTPEVTTTPKNDIVSEIDILQALKNEILSETIAIPGAEEVTPALHQPKVTGKVTNAQEIVKKKISLEHYKKKATMPTKKTVFKNIPRKIQNLEDAKKIRLTDKELERFNVPSRLSLDDYSSDEEEDIESADIEPNEIYSDMAPRSPDRESVTDSKLEPEPVIIPVEPVKPAIQVLANDTAKADVDMRKSSIPKISPVAIGTKETNEKNLQRPIDPRIRKDIGNSPLINPGGTPRPLPVLFPNLTPNPRTFEVTPSHSFDSDQGRKHVYAPSFNALDHDDRETLAANDNRSWERPVSSRKVSSNSRWDNDRAGSLARDDSLDQYSYQHNSSHDYRHREQRDPRRNDDGYSPATPIHYFGRGDCPSTPSHPFGRDPPRTPVHHFGRGDCPSTPVHPFGRGDCPSTPVHPFGRSDCPSTPVHPFGKSEAPTTPNHPFGRGEGQPFASYQCDMNEAPRTPSHQFGRSEFQPINSIRRSECPSTPSHPFGRSESNSNESLSKRDSCYESRYNFTDKRERSFSKDRNLRYDRNSCGKGKYRYSHGEPHRRYSRDECVERRREPSAGRFDQNNDPDNNFNSRSVLEVGLRRPNHERGRSVSRAPYQETNRYRSSSRGPSDVRYDRDRSAEKSVSVESHAGRSFTIDTSVTATFQGATTDQSITDLNDRRQRASSVGRTLTREPSVGRTIADDFQPTFNKRFYTNKLNMPFTRARSIGRDTAVQPERNFKDIKANFDAFKEETLSLKNSSNDSNKTKVLLNKESTSADANARVKTPTPTINIRDPRSRRDAFDAQDKSKDSKKDSYSPRKNMRDPRVRKEQDSIPTRRYSDKYDGNKNITSHSRSDPHDKQVGIAYTNDNLAKGNILGPGYGVKNYKIPKIKKSEPEIQPEAVKNPEPAKTPQIDIIPGTAVTKPAKLPETLTVPKSIKPFKPQDEPPKPQRPSKKNQNVKQNKERPEKQNIEKTGKTKHMKARKISESSDDTTPLRRRRIKNNFVSDSDSDDHLKTNTEVSNDSEVKTDKVSKSKLVQPSPSQSSFDNNEDISTDMSFTFDINDAELDLFSENVASDNVIDNINDLIANLDKDIGTNKTDDDLLTQIGKENTFESILESFNSADSSSLLAEKIPDIALKPSSELPLNAIPISVPQSTDAPAPMHAEEIRTITPREDTNNQIDNKVGNVTNEVSNNDGNKEMDSRDFKENNEAIVSTSNTEQCGAELLSESDAIDKNADAGSTPDSTIDIDQPAKEASEGMAGRVPDSTNEAHTDMHPDISSTHDHTKEISPKPPVEEKVPANSFGSILSLLKDKSKIRELLSMLDDGEESEKIKKKLEKLSQIVSDDEDEENKNSVEHKTEKRNEESNSSDQVKDIKNKAIEKLDGKLVDDGDEYQSEPLEQSNNEETEKKSKLPAKKRSVKKVGIKRKGIGNRFKKQQKAVKTDEIKRITRSAKQKPKRANRELQQLHNDLRDMLIGKDILNATGIRKCRIAKLVEKSPTSSEESTPMKSKEPVDRNDTDSGTDEPLAPLATKNSTAPKVILEKFPVKQPEQPVKVRKKPGPKPKIKQMESVTTGKISTKYKPGPRSKKKVMEQPNHCESDPYLFDDSLNDTTKAASLTSPPQSGSESDDDDESLASSHSFGSTELLVESKSKNKRKRKGGWSAGVIKRAKKKVPMTEMPEIVQRTPTQDILPKVTTQPDLECFTDKDYCFLKRIIEYECRLCTFVGKGIVNHYKTEHPHYEIPLSRLNIQTAEEAIKQSMITNFQVISKTPMTKYVCRFCYMVFTDKRKNLLEEFFWHVVNNHTGEFEQKCSMCDDPQKCPFMLDIPPAPKNKEGLLLGYICGKCNYTQVSLENLKNHVSLRHNDEETEVTIISLGVLSYVMINALKSKFTADEARSLRSQRVQDKSSKIKDLDEPKTQEENAPSPSPPPMRSVQSMINFEPDGLSDVSKPLDEGSDPAIKSEKEDDDDDHFNHAEPTSEPEAAPAEIPETLPETDVCCETHFKINITDAGAKEYVCCINGDHHYKTSLLISIKRHVQLKHASDRWDGFCSICKVIVMPQGKHKFNECLLHLLDKHIDDFPVAEKSTLDVLEEPVKSVASELASPKPYINVRPISELLVQPKETEVLPKIESVISLNAEAIPNPLSEELLPSETVTDDAFVPTNVPKPVVYEYEEFQSSVMSKKHRIVLDAMLTPEKLCHVFKCSGKFCSFTCDLAEDALDHLMTHQRVGGEGVLVCCYCSFDASGNAIDLVTHTFNEHGKCRYSCRYCFYRAATSALIEVHSFRRHPDLGPGPKVLLAMGVPITTTESEGILTRNEAVDYYCCNHVEADAKCKFKTYTSGKFVEHLQTKHPDASVHSCSICESVQPSPEDLVSHLFSHGIMLYQCVWCRFGADSERELLLHGSMVHPNRRPQAYLRHIIETMDASSSAPKLKVLPLVQIGRASQLELQVPASTNRENAKREAERAVDLEKLIGHTTQVIEESHAPQVTQPPIEEPIEPPETIIPDLREPPTEITPPREDPQVKSEPVETRSDKSTHDVICLDSDDEPNTSTEVDKSIEKEVVLVEDDNSKRVSLSQLYKCGKCSTISKNGPGMKRHILYCYPPSPSRPEMRCAFCQYSHTNRDTLLLHYKLAHGPVEISVCTFCSYEVSDERKMKYHLQTIHKINSMSTKYFTKKRNEVLEKIPPARKTYKRKRSTTLTPPVTPSKQKRYGPDDINQLPINQILDESVYCSLCEYNTKVRLNMVRHLQLHAQSAPVAETAPVNPVPHLETNEMHFDRMVNLASSSVANKDKNKEATPVVHISPEVALRYPQFVPERKRFTCGAKNCNYISIDEAMLKCHWETLHSGSNEYHCVHCPPNQQLDTSRPLTATRIIAHLKMHDVKLFACSKCLYYHHQMHLVEKHIGDKHGGSGQVKVLREAQNSTVQPVTSTAPTMDLKPWQCGLCNFKSMLRPEVVDHCSKNHNSKFQFKCNFCPWRTSAKENVKKHHMTSHSQVAEEFYFYYREGSIPDEDGIPRWLRQRLAAGLPAQPEVKTESNPEQTVPPKPTVTPVNLSLVKTEPEEVESLERLVERFGAFCEPSGLRFRCPLCKTCQDDKEGMRSHLYEELKYRKWGCIFCSYKAFHKTGLKEHALQEHQNTEDLATELPSDPNIERWVAKAIEHQEEIISSNLKSLKLQTPSTSQIVPQKQNIEMPVGVTKGYTDEALETAFGPFGTFADGMFSCPKCDFKVNDELRMKEHLEVELAKVRWCCSACPAKFQNYHQAQLHCKSEHSGGGARASEALREPAARAAWVQAALRAPPRPPSLDTPPEEDSLLMVRYEQPVPTPECRKRTKDDSDDERLVIDESQRPPPKRSALHKCHICHLTFNSKITLDYHILRHYNLKPYQCPYCTFNAHHATVLKHIDNLHHGCAREAFKVKVPDRPPDRVNLNEPLKTPETKQPAKMLTCLICEQFLSEKDVMSHSHPDCAPQLAEKGDLVYKCCICLKLRINLPRMKDHFKSDHPKQDLNYALFKLHMDNREVLECRIPNCLKRFTFIRDLRSHHSKMHGAAELCYGLKRFSLNPTKEDANGVQILDDVTVKRVAKKSTTKLPITLSVARKSTTKLPFYALDEDEDVDSDSDYSYYGTKPTALAQYSAVTTQMPFMNTVMPFTLQKLSEIVNLTPQVRVKDCRKQF